MRKKQILSLLAFVVVVFGTVVLMSYINSMSTAPELASATSFDNCCYDVGWLSAHAPNGCGNGTGQVSWQDGWSACFNGQCGCNISGGAQPNPGTPASGGGGGSVTANKTVGQACKPFECQAGLSCVTCGAGTNKNGSSVCSPALTGDNYYNACGGTYKLVIPPVTSTPMATADSCGAGSHASCNSKNTGDVGVAGVCNCWHASAKAACACITIAGSVAAGGKCFQTRDCADGLKCDGSLCKPEGGLPTTGAGSAGPTAAGTGSTSSAISSVDSSRGMDMSQSRGVLNKGGHVGACSHASECAPNYACVFASNLGYKACAPLLLVASLNSQFCATAQSCDPGYDCVYAENLGYPVCIYMANTTSSSASSTAAMTSRSSTSVTTLSSFSRASRLRHRSTLIAADRPKAEGRKPTSICKAQCKGDVAPRDNFEIGDGCLGVDNIIYTCREDGGWDTT